MTRHVTCYLASASSIFPPYGSCWLSIQPTVTFGPFHPCPCLWEWDYPCFSFVFFCTDDVIQFCYAGQCRVGGVGIIALTDNLKPFPTIHASIASVGQMAMSAHPTKSGIYIGWTGFSRFLSFLFVLIGFDFLSLDLSRYFPSFPYFWLKVLFGGGWGFLDWVISKVDSIPSFLRTFSSIFKSFNKPL